MSALGGIQIDLQRSVMKPVCRVIARRAGSPQGEADLDFGFRPPGGSIPNRHRQEGAAHSGWKRFNPDAYEL